MTGFTIRCSYGIGVLDTGTAVLRAAPAEGGRVLRMEPRVRGLDYDLTAAPAKDPVVMDREMRLANNKRCALQRLAHSNMAVWPPLIP